MKITFFGAARTVTGSKHLVSTQNNVRFLLDCGLFQGSDNDASNRHFGFDPASLDFMILSHAHADHSGLIPMLVSQGFKGEIYCTDATQDLCAIMLEDSAHIQENDARYLNKKRAVRNQDMLKPLYTVDDVKIAMKQFVKVDLNKSTELRPGIRLIFTDAGHILGSAAVNLEIDEAGKTRELFFSGDTGRYNTQLLRDPQAFPQADIIIMESTYGDREHEDTLNAEEHLLRIVMETCVEKKGKLIIPAFSLGRTQELVYSFDRLNTEGRMPPIPVYVDSPLAVNATMIMQKHTAWFNRNVQEYLSRDSNPFGYEQLIYIREVESSKALNELHGPCIIISASGMMEAGRIRHHLKNNLSERNNTVLIVGYVPENTLGDRLLKGDPEVSIFGKPVKVNARIEELDSYSAHGDYQEMLRYLSCQNPVHVSKMFLVHGEPPALDAWRIRLEKTGFRNVTIPAFGESFEV
jgi:metallo-beta-lactamase family protein